MKWQQELSLGIKQIDEQHKMLEQILDNLYDACSRGEGLTKIKEAIRFLEWYVIKHFEDEEMVQEKYNYPRIEEHRQAHQLYSEELAKLLKEIKMADMSTEHIAKVVAYLTKLIREHVQEEDRVLGYYLRHHKLYVQEKKEKKYVQSGITGFMTKKEIERVTQYKIGQPLRALAYVILQIDRFNDVNRTYGYEAGNEVLIYVSGILRRYESQKCIISHVYQNEFMLCLDMKDTDAIDAVLSKIHQTIYDGFKRKGSIIPLSVSMGVAIADNEKNLNTFIQKANIALGVAKNRGGNQKVYYDETMHQEIMRQSDIINMLQPHSLEQHLKVVYQPIYDLQAGRIKGCEALLRMIDDRGEFISPDQFIPLAESNNLINDIGYYCMNEVCKAFPAIKCGDESFRYISVNLSMYQLKDASLVERMDEIAKSHGIGLEHIYFELTESMIIENTGQVQQVIKDFKEKNSKILLDDFGSGYSALSYLSQLDIDIIKIDKSFLKHIHANQKAYIILKEIIKLIQGLGFTTVVEGVETKEELEKLREMGADSIQGYYISKPASKEEIVNSKRCICLQRY